MCVGVCGTLYRRTTKDSICRNRWTSSRNRGQGNNTDYARKVIVEPLLLAKSTAARVMKPLLQLPSTPYDSEISKPTNIFDEQSLRFIRPSQEIHSSDANRGQSNSPFSATSAANVTENIPSAYKYTHTPLPVFVHTVTCVCVFLKLFSLFIHYFILIIVSC